ncbi:MAG: DUF6932 family protein [Acidimicrobiales bacterium]
MSIPPLDPDTGYLPPGEHEATWREVVDCFGWNQHRRRLLEGLADGLVILGRAGCSRVWVNDSFVTAKEEPADFDVAWDPEDVDLDKFDPVFFELAEGRIRQKQRFGGEFLPDVNEQITGLTFSGFFQSDRDGGQKGIVVIEPRRAEQ